MKRLIFVLFIIAFASAQATTNAFAHILKSDKDIGGVMHIDPEDDPIINEPTHFMFEIKDKTNKFDAQKCDCSIAIEGVNDSQKAKMHAEGNTNIQYEYIFTQKGIYTITVTGKPLQSGLFQEFTLTYDLRVERENTKQQKDETSVVSNDQKINIVISLVAIIFVTILIAKLGKSTKKILPIILILTSLQFSLLSSTKYFRHHDISAHTENHQTHATHPPCCLPALPVTSAYVYVNPPSLIEITYTISPQRVFLSHQRPPARDKSPPYLS